jgi:hypothetical protein
MTANIPHLAIAASHPVILSSKPRIPFAVIAARSNRGEKSQSCLAALGSSECGRVSAILSHRIDVIIDLKLRNVLADLRRKLGRPVR